VEAIAIDEIFSHAKLLKDDAIKTDGTINHYPFHSLHPIGQHAVKTYTKSKINLAGIIDHPQNLRSISNAFLRTLVWNLCREFPENFPER
jgi:hypothetical protein